jgi:BirA family transcriptional regulator, biotin operon repressor / biotin---[acetyl-CoA-carboxylase] ligase
MRGTATSLAAAGGSEDAGELLSSFLRTFRPAYQGLPGGVVDRYREVCVTLRRRVRARTIEGAVVEGVAVDLDPGGGLIVETAGGPRTVGFGEVAHLT